MIQYIINCSAIWLLSLLVYDLFLRRSTFHVYNRYYLLGTLLAGICIPLFSLVQKSNFSPQTKRDYGIEKAFELKSNLVAATQTGAVSRDIDWETGLLLVYLFGLIVSISFMFKDFIQIFRLYHKGNKSFTYGVGIIETQKNHSPFSFFGYIFLSSISAYTDEQLSMILAHEKCHNRLWHGADLLLVQLCKIIFWFHPLLYFYTKRLLMVHEYQADRAVEKPLDEYGSFLVEQTIFAPSPSITHSFYHSPIKKRILMLTRKSTTMSKSKVLLAIPVLFISLVCFSKDAFSDGKPKYDYEKNTVSYKGNTFELYAPPGDTMIAEDPVTGKKQMTVFELEPYPVKMNHKKLYSSQDVDEQAVLLGTKDNDLLLEIKKNKELLNQLNDGEYRFTISQVVTSEKGRVLFYIWEGILSLEGGGGQPVEPQSVAEKINQNIDHFLSNLAFHPAKKNGKSVNFFAGNILGNSIVVTVKDHKANIQNVKRSIGQRVMQNSEIELFEK